MRGGLSAYQALLAVDYLVSNKARRSVMAGEHGVPLLATRDNDAFTPQPGEAALTDPELRLTRHVTYSASLLERLRGLDRDRLAQALNGIAVTPRELDLILERKRWLEKLVSALIRTRGKERALGLP